MQTLYQNYSQNNGAVPTETTALASSPTSSVETASSGARGSRSRGFLRGKNKTKDDSTDVGTVHRIQEAPTEGQPNPLCILSCCGRGRLYLSWAVSIRRGRVKIRFTLDVNAFA